MEVRARHEGVRVALSLATRELCQGQLTKIKDTPDSGVGLGGTGGSLVLKGSEAGGGILMLNVPEIDGRKPAPR